MTTVKQLIARADSIPPGKEKRSILDEALDLARSDENLDQEFTIRGRILQSAPIEDDIDKEDVLTQVSSLIALHESNSARFPGDSWPGALFWYFSWAVEFTVRSTAFTREHVEQLLESMRQAFSRAGQSLASYEEGQLLYAVARGDGDAARQHSVQLDSFGRKDPWIECDAHTASMKIGVELENGQPESAIKLLNQVLDDSLTCDGEPETTIGMVLPAYMRLAATSSGSERDEILERIAFLVRRSTEGEGKLMSVEGIGGHLLVLASGGGLELGKALVESGLRRVSADPLGDYECAWFLIGAGAFLDALVEAGYGHVPIAGSEDSALARLFGPSDTPRTAEQLAPLAWKAAQRIGDAFDQRDGHDGWKRRLSDGKELSRIRLPLSLSTNSLPLKSDASPRDVLVDSPQRWLAVLTVAIGMNQTSTVDKLLDQFSSMTTQLGPHEQVAAESMRLNRAIGRNEMTLEDAHDTIYELRRKLGHHECATVMKELGANTFADPAPHREKLRELMRQYPEDNPATGLVATLYAHAITEQTGPVTAEDILETCEVIDRAAHTAKSHITAYALRINVLAAEGRFDELTTEYQRAVNELDQDVHLMVHVHAAEIFAKVGLREQALSARDRAIAERLRLGLREGLVNDVIAGTYVLREMRQHDEAISRLDFAIREAKAQGHSGEAIRSIELYRGFELTLAGNHNEAIDVFERELVVVLADEPNDPSIPESLMALGESLKTVGRLDEATAAWRKGVTSSLEHNLVSTATSTVIMLADQIEEESEFAESLDKQQLVLAAARDGGNPHLVVDLLTRIAVTQSRMNDNTALDTLDEAATIGATIDRDFTASPTRALVLRNLGRWEGSAQVQEAIAEQAMHAGDPFEAAQTLVWGANTLEDGGLIESAASMLKRAREVPDLPVVNLAQVWDVTALFWERQGDLDRARAAREESARLNESSQI